MTRQALTIEERKEIGAMEMRLNELFAIADRDAETHRALERAASWLNQINDPLTESELDAWNAVNDDALAQMDANDMNDALTAEDKRGMTRYMVEE